MTLTYRHLRTYQNGFSLVEVALAVAIAALGIITCLGLLPEGLEMSRRTNQMAINSNILEQIIRDIENAQGWRTIKNSYAPPAGFPSPGVPATPEELRKTYDYQGTPLAEDDDDAFPAFVVEVSNDQPCGLPGVGGVLPGLPSGAGGGDQPYLARLVIKIANSTDRDFAFDNAPPGSFQTFHHIVAKTH
ncbi:MAG: Verru_Chthon cassette protein B [Verrucomicrobiaceae bacterium]|nr:Verru_Chthon cassette protein B [Verrucomicrobiaceae bacterium]